MREAAKTLNIAPQPLRRKFGHLAKSISARYLDHLAVHTKSRTEARLRWIQASAEDMAAEGLRLTPKNVIARLGLSFQECSAPHFLDRHLS